MTEVEAQNAKPETPSLLPGLLLHLLLWSLGVFFAWAAWTGSEPWVRVMDAILAVSVILLSCQTAATAWKRHRES